MSADCAAPMSPLLTASNIDLRSPSIPVDDVDDVDDDGLYVGLEPTSVFSDASAVCAVATSSDWIAFSRLPKSFRKESWALVRSTVEPSLSWARALARDTAERPTFDVD